MQHYAKLACITLVGSIGLIGCKPGSDQPKAVATDGSITAVAPAVEPVTEPRSTSLDALTSTVDCEAHSSTYAQLAADKVGATCFTPSGATTHAAFRTVTDPDAFLSACPIRVNNSTSPDDGPCFDGAFRKPIEVGDDLIVSKISGDYELAIVKATGTEKISLKDVSLPGTTLFSHLTGTTDDGTTVFVYLSNRTLSGSGTLDKYYEIEMFSKNVADGGVCDLHRPGSHSSTPACSLTIRPGGAQTNTSTGGEPPIRQSP